MAQEDLAEIERFLSLLTFKPSLIKIIFERIGLIPFRGFPLLIFFGSDHFRKVVGIWESIRHKVRSHNNDRVLLVRNAQRSVGNH
jgi:hypothetical protein